MNITTVEFIITVFTIGVSGFLAGGAVSISYWKKKYAKPQIEYLYKYLKEINGISKDLVDYLEGRNG